MMRMEKKRRKKAKEYPTIAGILVLICPLSSIAAVEPRVNQGVMIPGPLTD
jgi:hypothetical protein